MEGCNFFSPLLFSQTEMSVLTCLVLVLPPTTLSVLIQEEVIFVAVHQAGLVMGKRAKVCSNRHLFSVEQNEGQKQSSVYMSITWWMSFVTGNVHLPWEISTGPIFWTYTKHGPPVHGPLLWIPSMDYPCWPSLILEDEFYQSSKRILRNLNGQNFVNLYW